MLTVHLFTAAWVPLNDMVCEKVQAHCDTFGAHMKLHDADGSEAEQFRVVTVPTAVVVGPGTERMLRGTDVITRLDGVLAEAARKVPPGPAALRKKSRKAR